MPPKTRKRAETTGAPAFAKTRGQRIARGGFRRVPKHVPKSLEYVQAKREAEENGNAVAGNRGGVDASTTGRHGGELVERNDETALAVHEALEVAARGEDYDRGESDEDDEDGKGRKRRRKQQHKGIGYIASKGRGRHVGTQANMLGMLDLADEETVRETLGHLPVGHINERAAIVKGLENNTGVGFNS